MASAINYAPRTDDKRELWSMKIDPKLKYLALVAAKDEGRSLSAFVERAIHLALQAKEERESAEPDSGGILIAPKQEKALWGIHLWDENDADRFFKRATSRYDLLSTPEKRLFTLFTMYMKHIGRRITMKSFREFWSNPSINTSHLKESGK